MVRVKSLLPLETFERSLPVTNSALVRAEFGLRLHAEYTECHVATLTQSRFVGLGVGGVVITHDDKVVRPYSPPRNEADPRFHNALSAFRLPPVVRTGKAVVVATRCADNNYGHWMLDHMPRFWSLAQTGVGEGDATLYIPGGKSKYQQYMLSRLPSAGLRFASVVGINPRLHIEAESLVIPSYVNPSLNMVRYGHRAKQLRFVAGLVENVSLAPDRQASRIFVSRAKARRAVAAEPAILELLTPLGFQAVCLEDYSVPEQAALFRDAQVVVAFHGAGLTNLIFSRSGTVVIEIFAPDFIVTNFWSICHDLDLRYFAYCDDARAQGIAAYGQAQAAAVEVSASSVAGFVAECLRA
jgi:capsular polysaccharide biosynthesis protein